MFKNLNCTGWIVLQTFVGEYNTKEIAIWKMLSSNCSSALNVPGRSAEVGTERQITKSKINMAYDKL